MNPDDVHYQSMDQFASYYSPLEEAKNCNVIGVLCKQKAQAFHGLGDKQNCQLWSELAMETSYWFFQDNLDLPDAFTSQLVNTTLIIAELDLSQRPRLFNELVCHLFCETKHCSFYIASSLKEGSSYGELKFDTVIPFIEHFLKCCTKEFLCDAKKDLEYLGYKMKIDPNISLESQRNQMITYRNSLLIMKHFNSLPRENI